MSDLKKITKEEITHLTNTLRLSWAKLNSIFLQDTIILDEISDDDKYYFVSNKISWKYREFIEYTTFNKKIIVALEYYENGTLQPKCFFRIIDNILYISRISYHYVFVNSAQNDYLISEINNNKLLKIICLNTDFFSFNCYSKKYDLSFPKKNNEFNFEQTIYIQSADYFISISPELLLGEDFRSSYGKPDISNLTLLDRNIYKMNIAASKRTSYLSDTDSDIEAIFDLKNFKFEKFEISQTYYNLK